MIGVDQVFIGFVTLAASVGSAFFASQWFNRRNLSKLTRAQADGEEAKTLQITDTIARQWILDLRTEMADLRGQLETKDRTLRAALAYIQRLLGWVEDRFPDGAPNVPQIPSELVDLLD